MRFDRAKSTAVRSMLRKSTPASDEPANFIPVIAAPRSRARPKLESENSARVKSQCLRLTPEGFEAKNFAPARQPPEKSKPAKEHFTKLQPGSCFGRPVTRVNSVPENPTRSR